MPNQDFTDLVLPKAQAGRSGFVFFKIIFLPLIIYIFALLAYCKIINFSIGLHTIVMMSVIFIFALIFSRHSAEFAYTLFVSKSDDFKTSLKEFIISHLLEFGGVKKANAKFDDFLDGYTKDFRNDNLAAIGVAVFPMLGILGTFISIAISMPSFSSSTSGELEKEIGVLLNGVGTAFYVSIYGIFLALWWMFFERIGMSKFERFANEQKQLSYQFFWQKEELEQQYMSTSVSHYAGFEKIFARIGNEEFFNRLDDTIEAKFNTFKELENLERKIIGEAKVGFDENVGLLAKISSRQDEFLAIHSSILKALVALNTTIKESQTQFVHQHTKISEIAQNRADSFERSLIKFNADLKTLELSLKNFAVKILDEQDMAMKSFRDSIFQGAQAFNAIYQQEIRSNGREKEREVLIAELKKSISEIDEEANRIIKNLENIKDEVK
ncbi:MotA/TolQ/ExbB proton channel family protein [Campylobacter sp. faydin G-140]|uniref:MotA/TolQ/ExbB proton channel family protein n=1 Tax=Campylobacter anatolicus TaxID=2829105 RepID=UPI001B9B1DFE|nr:MotA/TolQ/ExbB proton channel family protein [Campylobacter anatolicus]MBR8464865.1 MotA/TolQ/ExbB proton channel family protein [Campylobacter anatolicus]